MRRHPHPALGTDGLRHLRRDRRAEAPVVDDPLRPRRPRRARLRRRAEAVFRRHRRPRNAGSPAPGGDMKITLTSVLVDDQAKALAFYTDVLGFRPKTDVPLGEHRWLTVVSPEAPDGVELVLEPDEHPAAKPFKAALVEDGIPFTCFAVDDVQAEYERLRGLGVRFTQEPTAMGPVTTAVFDDTCGNLIQMAQASTG